MDQPITIGLDLAKNVFQVHGAAEGGTVVLRRQIRRSQMLVFFSRLEPCLVGMEACAGAHYWGRELTALGHEIRAHLGGFGIVVAKGIHNVDRLLEAARDVPAAARPALDLLADQLRDLRGRIDTVTERIAVAQADDPLARRLATVPGIGVISSSALAATTPDVGAFRTARDHAAWLGLTPKPHSSGGKERLGRISKAGNRYLRRLLYLGAMAQIAARRRRAPCGDWLGRMLARKPVKAVAIALANRMARTVWALTAKGDSYRVIPA